jgi:hypothetical protein
VTNRGGEAVEEGSETFVRSLANIHTTLQNLPHDHAIPRRQDDELGQTTVSTFALRDHNRSDLISLFRMANVVGTQEPIYGPSAIRSVVEQAETNPYTEMTKDDVKWEAMVSTCVETQTFYLYADSGHICFVQVIYSNVA